MSDKLKLLLRGGFLTRSGYGRHCLFLLRSLKEREDIDLYLITTNWGACGYEFLDTPERRYIDDLIRKTAIYIQNKGRFDASIQVTIPLEFEKLAPINIGVTAGIETNKISPSWLPKCQLVDKIIVPSEHARSGFLVKQKLQDQAGNVHEVFCQTPIDVVSYPWEEKEKDEKFDLDLKTDFNFLSVAQWGPRKNIEQTVSGFLQEFHSEPVGLVLKMNIKNDSIIDNEYALKNLKSIVAKAENNFPDRQCKIYLLHGYMTEEEMSTMYQHPKVKALVNLSFGEGFGLGTFEAAGYGLPIVSPDWGGVSDIIGVEDEGKRKAFATKVEFTLAPVQKEAVWKNVIEPDMLWAFPQMNSYRFALRKVYKDYGICKKRAEKLQENVKIKFEAKKQHEMFAESVMSAINDVRAMAISRSQNDIASRYAMLQNVKPIEIIKEEK